MKRVFLLLIFLSAKAVFAQNQSPEQKLEHERYLKVLEDRKLKAEAKEKKSDYVLEVGGVKDQNDLLKLKSDFEKSDLFETVILHAEIKKFILKAKKPVMPEEIKKYIVNRNMYIENYTTND